MISGTNGLSVGICNTQIIDQVVVVNNDPNRVDLYCGNGNFVDLNNDEHKCLGRAVKKGEIVNICLDMDMGTITLTLLV